MNKLLTDACIAMGKRRKVLIGREYHERLNINEAAHLFVQRFRGRQLMRDCFLDADLL